MDSGLTDEMIAREYLGRGGGYFSADHLVAWMDQRGIGHRNAAGVALAVNRLQAGAEPIPEQAVFEVNLAEGIGDRRQELDEVLAQRVQAMSMAEFSAARGRLGLHHRNVTDFLGGVE